MIKYNEENPALEYVKKAVKDNNGYCPCKLIRNKDTKCVCKEFRKQEEGVCHCGLYIKM